MTTIPDRETADTFPVAAILLFVTSLILAALNGAIMKALAGSLPALTIIWARFLVYSLIMLPFALPAYGWAVLRPPNLRLQLLRVALMVFTTWCFITGVSGLAFADAIAILYIYPFVIIALSPFFLGEQVSRIAWLCVISGFAGVLIVMRPKFDATGVAALYVLAAGITLGSYLVATRLLVRARSPLITSTFTGLVITLATSFAVPFYWQPLTVDQLVLIAAMGVVTAASQYLMLMAFARSAAPVLAPFAYAEIPAAAAIGFVMFAEMPDAIAWFGIAIIVSSGLIVARSSAGRRSPPRPRQPVP